VGTHRPIMSKVDGQDLEPNKTLIVIMIIMSVCPTTVLTENTRRQSKLYSIFLQVYTVALAVKAICK
jgi:hypothetical protein